MIQKLSIYITPQHSLIPHTAPLKPERLTLEQQSVLVDYLFHGTIVMRITDRIKTSMGVEEIEQIVMSDGVYVWGSDVTDAVRDYGVCPSSEFVAYVENQKGQRPAPLSGEQVGDAVGVYSTRRKKA